LQIIQKNFGLKVLSFTLAVIGWAYLRFAGNAVIAAHFDQQLSIPIEVANLSRGYAARYTQKEATVTISLRSGEPQVKASDVRAIVDLIGKTPGAYNVPVQVVAPSVLVQSLSPASVSLTIDQSGAALR
jgi:YbbR domain-containing protein